MSEAIRLSMFMGGEASDFNHLKKLSLRSHFSNSFAFIFDSAKIPLRFFSIFGIPNSMAKRDLSHEPKKPLLVQIVKENKEQTKLCGAYFNNVENGKFFSFVQKRFLSI